MTTPPVLRLRAEVARRLRFRWQWWLKATPDQLWPFVSDTDRFNRDTGLPPVRRLANNHQLAFRPYGIGIEWDEEPFEWVRPFRFGVRRRYRSGPAAWMQVLVELIPEREGTRLIYETLIEPRRALGLPIVALGMALVNRPRFGKIFARYDRLARTNSPSSADVPYYLEHRHRARSARGTEARLAPGGSSRLSATKRLLQREMSDANLVDLRENARRQIGRAHV